MKYRTDLILGEAFCVFIFFNFPAVQMFSNPKNNNIPRSAKTHQKTTSYAG